MKQNALTINPTITLQSIKDFKRSEASNYTTTESIKKLTQLFLEWVKLEVESNADYCGFKVTVE